jgi:hypothetical protein
MAGGLLQRGGRFGRWLAQSCATARDLDAIRFDEHI